MAEWPRHPRVATPHHAPVPVLRPQAYVDRDDWQAARELVLPGDTQRVATHDINNRPRKLAIMGPHASGWQLGVQPDQVSRMVTVM